MCTRATAAGYEKPVMGEKLQCGKEVDNPHNLYAVSVLKRRQIVGHVPRNIQTVFSASVEPWHVITYTVTTYRIRGKLQWAKILQFQIKLQKFPC